MAPAASSTEASTSCKPISVLFVCLGNICRSPLAEAIFRNLTAYSTPSQHPLISHIDSCGTGAYHAGDYSDPRTISVLAEHGIKDYKHRARKIRMPEDFMGFDYIIAMDEENLEDLREMVRRGKKRGLLSGEEEKKCYLFGRFGGESQDEEIGDPYYGGRDGFEKAYEQAVRMGKGLLRVLEEEGGRATKADKAP